jgi:hypothetical protein
LLHSASKLKRGVIEGTGELFWFSVYVNFSSPIYFVVFFAVNRDEDIVRESFSVKCILHSSWYAPLVYVLWTFFSMWSSVFGLCCFFFSQPDVNITLITGHIHRSNVYKIDPTSEYVEMVNKTISITMGYIILWNVIRRIYLPCLQLMSKKYFV